MRFFIEDLEVIFPYPVVYKEQFEYMKELKRILDNQVYNLFQNIFLFKYN